MLIYNVLEKWQFLPASFIQGAPRFLPSLASKPRYRGMTRVKWRTTKGVKQSSEGPEGILKETGREEDALGRTGVCTPSGGPEESCGWRGRGWRFVGQEAQCTGTRSGPGKPAPEMKQRTHESQMKGSQNKSSRSPKRKEWEQIQLVKKKATLF